MTTDEAFEYTLSMIEELRQEGIKVQVVPYKDKAGQAGFDRMRRKYSGPERIKPEKWCRAQFSVTVAGESEKIKEAAVKLSWLGIHFDTGGCAGCRDWELDWSFKYNGQPDGEREHLLNVIEDIHSTLDQQGEVEG